MALKIDCPHCGKVFSAWDDLVGQSVQCPKCNGQVQVGGASPPAPRGEPIPREEDEIEELSLEHVVEDVAQDAGDEDIEALTLEAEAEIPRLELPNMQWPETSQPAAARSQPAPETPQSKTLQPGPEDPAPLDRVFDSNCPSCHAPMMAETQLCEACGFHKVVGRRIREIVEPPPAEKTGVGRWMDDQIATGESPQSIKIWAGVVGGFAIIFLTIFLMATFGFLCGLAGFVLMLGAAGTAAFFIFRRPETMEEIRKQGNSSFWTYSLAIGRATTWRDLSWPFAKRRELSFRNQPFGDDDLAVLTELDQCQALDLENTQITEASFALLAQKKQLEFLVLIGTRASKEDVQRLQNVLLNTWIWF